jgi:lysophospholipase L1-like esterase
MRSNKFFVVTSLVFIITLTSFVILKREKPILYIIGDSTVKNGDGTGKGGLWGWGSFIEYYFDTSKITIRNHAIGGRSSRTFMTEGRWDTILIRLKKGDYILMQFGHNDSGPLDDSARARGTLKGIDDNAKEIFNPITKRNEVVHTYGWYIRKYVQDAKSKGAIPIVCSPIPRNDWKNGKVIRVNDSYGSWAAQIAKEEGAPFIDLNNLVAFQYESLGQARVAPFFPQEHTHTGKEGAALNARIIVNELKRIEPSGLEKYLLQ